MDCCSFAFVVKTTGLWSMSVKTYLKNVIDKIEGLLIVHLKNYESPMGPDEHPEEDDSELLLAREVSIYQILIGCAQWAITLGRFDIQYATNTLARYASMPREGHMKSCLRIFCYLKYHTKGRIMFDPSDPNYDNIDFGTQDWTDLYPDAAESISEKTPVSKNAKPLKLTVIVDASHASDLVTRRSVTGYLLFVGITPIVKWYSKRQNTVESSSYGSELVAMRLALEALLELTRKTKELDHEKLVTVFLGPLSHRHWLVYLYMEIVARRTRRTKATDTDLYIFISDGKRVFDCSVEQTDHSMEQRLSLAYSGDLS
jgi:hypothetical protein